MGFFDDKQEELRKELDSWVGVPFKHRQGTKSGVDCIHLVARVLESFGFGPFKFNDYTRDWHLHKTSGLLMNEVKKQIPTVVEVSINEIKNGDLVVYHVGKDSAHGAIYFDNYVYHAITGIGVVKIRWDSALKFKNTTYAVAHILRVM